MANYNLTHTWQQVDDATEQSLQTADYIVEQGVNGAWAYTKYNSGKVDAYCNQFVFTAAANALTEQQISVPSGIFIDAPSYIHAFIMSTTGSKDYGLLNLFARNSGNTATAFKIAAANASNTALSPAVVVHAIGRWK